MKYLNTTGRLITVNVLDKMAGKVVKTVLVPGKPIDVQQAIMDKARKESVVVSHYFKSGEIVKFSNQKVVEKTPEPDKTGAGTVEGTKEFMLKALHESGIEEYIKLNGRNSEKSVKEAYDKMIVGVTEGSDIDTTESGAGDSGDE